MSRQHSPIKLGVELAHDDVAAAVDCAVEAERLGLDLVVVPSTSSGPDGWPLVSWIAGRTDRIGLVAGIDPAQRNLGVLGRASTSLDRLSGGRLTLELHPSPEISPAEALTVLRRMWDTSTRRVHHDGAIKLAGAEPGPLPAHDIRIWMSGDVELAGSTADGWHGRLDDPDQLAQNLQLLRKSAEKADRDPHELERVITLTTWDDVDAMTTLVTEHGVTAFILHIDENSPEGLLERFVQEIAPRLREAGRQAVADGALTPSPVRRAEIRARRVSGIDYDGLPAHLAANAVEPGDALYNSIRSNYLRGGSPGLILRPQSVSDVVDAVAFARRHRHIPLGIRSGGHGVSGRSTNDGGLVIDVGALNDIEVLDRDRRLVRIGPGARWRDVATALQPYGWALGSGDHGGVGVGGLATAGGIGYLSRKHGLTIDHLQSVDMVLADGTTVRAGRSENPELFWAVRGAGANFGIVTSFEFVVDEVSDVGWAQLAFHVSDPEEFLLKFGETVAATPRDTTPFLIMNGSTAHVMAMVASDDPDEILAQLRPIAQIAPLVQQQVVIAPYAAVMNMFPESPHQAFGEPVSRSGLVTSITPGFAAVSARLLDSGAVHWFQLRSMGGAIADVEPDATAFAHRDAAFQITAMGSNAQRVDREWDRLRPYFSGIYTSFEADNSPQRLTEAFPPPTLARLRKLKEQLDPTGLFRDNFPLTDSHSVGSPA